MDNFDKIKFKEAESKGWFYKVDIKTGRKVSFNASRSPLSREMKAWEDSGNTIEAQYTEPELSEKEEKERTDALESQKQTCINLLHETQHKVNGDYDFPDDVPTWLRWRGIIKNIMRGSELKQIPDKPVF